MSIFGAILGKILHFGGAQAPPSPASSQLQRPSRKKRNRRL
jgi:hypothetical protein